MTPRYTENLDGITPEMLQGFFVGWPKPPSSKQHLEILQNSAYVVLALDQNRVIGFINAVSDQLLSAYIPLLEVLPEYKKMGIGKELVQRMLKQLDHLYMVDTCCDDALIPFYEKFGLTKSNGMTLRNYNSDIFERDA